MASPQYEHQQKKKANGICVICNKPLVTKAHCAEHAEKQAERNREWSRKNKGYVRRNKSKYCPNPNE